MIISGIGSALAVAAGAFLGGAGRHLLALRPGGRHGTWWANILACFVLGMLPAVPPGNWGLAVGLGFAGAMSTWSTLAGELGEDLRDRNWRRLGIYLTVKLGTAVLAFLAGAAVAG